MSRRGWLWVLLGVSVAANLFLVGLWAGGRYMDGDHVRSGRREPAAMAELPPSTREALRAAVREARPDKQAAREARREAARIVAAQSFDRAAAEAALRRSRDLNAAARARTDRALLDAASKLGPQERASLARLLRRGEERRGARPPR